MTMASGGLPPGLTPEIIDRCGQIVRQAASRAHTGEPVNAFELANAASALLGIEPPAWAQPSEFPDTRGLDIRSGPVLLRDGAAWVEFTRGRYPR